MKQSDKSRLLLQVNQTAAVHSTELSAQALYRWMREHRLPTSLDRTFDEAQAAAQTDLEPQFIIIRVLP